METDANCSSVKNQRKKGQEEKKYLWHVIIPFNRSSYVVFIKKTIDKKINYNRKTTLILLDWQKII